jgi:hypothetical protein
MTSNPTPPLSTAGTLLTVLQNSGGYITLGLELAGVFVPIIKGLISKIEGIGTGNVTIAFTELLAGDMKALDEIAQLSMEDLTAINAELTRVGAPTLPAPAPTPPPPIVQDATAAAPAPDPAKEPPASGS